MNGLAGYERISKFSYIFVIILFNYDTYGYQQHTIIS